ncbi:hypothetical protein SNE40_009904 [Patella caerulea]|uniref:Uncharacterized protein n=1 Tax=Patella caerulea TaxID=87958 RepID=A0AAN8Q3V6_PATCE
MPIQEIDDVLGSNEVLITQVPDDSGSSVYERGRDEESEDESDLYNGRRVDLHVGGEGGLVLSIADSEFKDCDTPQHLKSHPVDLNSLDSSDDDDYETDLEFDEERWLNPDRRDHDTTGKNKYLKVCKDLGVSPVSYFLKHIQDREMVMKFHGLGKDNTKAICIPLETNTQIETLNLSGNGIDTDGASFLVRVLKENFFITDLILAENRIGSAGAKAVCDLLLSNKTLVNVDLTGNRIDDKTAVCFHEVLLKNQTLKRLHLSYNRFEESGAKYFKEALMENESLEILDLSWNHFSTRGAVLLAEGLQENVGLKYFYIAMAGLGRDGAEAIGKALKSNRTLLELDISYSRIPVDGVCHLASGIKENDALQVLKMGFNPFEADAAMCMLRALDQNDSSAINYLDLSNVLVKTEFTELLSKISETRTLQVIFDGVLTECQHSKIPIEEMVKFRQDPIGVFKNYVTSSGLSLTDIFTPEESCVLREDEFRNILKNVNELNLTKEQVKVLCNKLSVNGIIDLSQFDEQTEEEDGPIKT